MLLIRDGGDVAEEEQGTRNPFAGFKLEIDPSDVESAMRRLRDQVRSSFTEGRYTKVRLSYKGKVLAPDIPLAVFLAGEGLAFWLVNPILAMLVNLGAKVFLDVEFIHEADELVRQGLEFYLDGDLEAAERSYREALERRPDDPSALYNLGTLLRVTNRKEEALTWLRKAAMGPEGHPDVARASDAIEKMTHPKKKL
jgi:tetratricopeptide (TPR) repeat protein